MRSQRLKFPGATGDRLAARLELPAVRPVAYALFAHCFTCSKDLKSVVRISRALVERRIAVLRFDFTGIGESEGDFADTNFSSNLDDLVAAADFLQEEYEAPKLLIGHSLGGAAVLAAAHRIPGSLAVATIGAPSDTRHLKETLLRKAPDLEARGEAEVTLGPSTFRIRRQLLEDLSRDHLEEALGELNRALLLFHSPVDEIVGIEHARRIYEAARHPKSFVSLDDANHLLTNPRDARYVAEMLAVWARRYVEEEGAEARETEEREVVLVEGGPSGFAQEIRVGPHLLTADEPQSLGGTDTGPTPYELLLAGLGACTSMTLRMYADRKEWPLDGVRIRLRHGKMHAQDCAECETKEGKIDRIEREVEVQGDLDPEQRERLLEIANRCPVHRTLTSEIQIESRLLTASE